jgi:protein-S-isoprenylcysteine O-methyltransferase Ste14
MGVRALVLFMAIAATAVGGPSWRARRSGLKGHITSLVTPSTVHDASSLGCSLVSSPLVLLPALLLVVVFELRSRHEESILLPLLPDCDAYRRRVLAFIPGLH